MESDESQDASSGNDSEVETYSTSSRDKSFSKKRSPSSKSSQSSRSRSRSSDAQSLKSSDNDCSNPQSPNSDNDNEENIPKRPQTPQSPESDSEYQQSSNRLRTPSPDNVSNDRAPSVNSSRSNSPQPQPPPHVSNNHRSPTPNGNNEDSQSAKSDSSQNSRKSKVSHDKDSESSDESVTSRSSRDVHKAANLDDGNTSDSSTSSDDSVSNVPKKPDSQPEEISDGELSDDKNNRDSEPQGNKKATATNISITHEDLSDVSDLEDSIDHSDYGTSKDIEQDVGDGSRDASEKRKKIIERSSQSEDAEEQLDFEAEDGECVENDNQKDKDDKDKSSEQELGELDDDGKNEKKEELEEGELTDEEDARPEETEPRPVCRFFSRGQCTWGASCRFLHPGVTDKGNYTMFDLVRPVVPGDYGSERVLYSGRSDPPPMESAWERGLRTAKEMMRKSIKRKEQDIDFEEKKMNLSLAQEELDKENGYYAKAPSPEPSRYVTMRPVEYASRAPHEEYYGRRQVVYDPEYTQYSRERIRTYREVQPYRQPDYYSNKHEEEPQSAHAKVKRPKREVIVQRAEERSGGRGDEWSDPWMRSKSPPGGRKGSRRRSYSSGSSYSSSSSSRSSSASSKSSYKSRSRHKRTSPRSHRRQVSPSVIVSERKAANERAALMNPPAPRKKAPSPGMMRVGAQNPPAPSKFDQFGRTRTKLVAALARVKGHTRSSRSSSASSSGSSSSDSDSSGSSSSSSKNGSPSPRRPTSVDLAIALKAKAIDALKSGSEKRQIKLNLKNTVGTKKADFTELTRKTELTQGKKRLANSPPLADRDPKNIINKKASSRREELLKQLKAVEDAIAKKRSKPN